jgi:hypothetical protein
MSNATERQSLMILDEKVQNSLSAVKHTEELLGAILRTYETACDKWPDLSDNDIAADMLACQMGHMSWCFDYKLCKQDFSESQTLLQAS